MTLINSIDQTKLLNCESNFNSKLSNLKVFYCRTEAALLTAEKGATEAQDEWVDLHGDELAIGQKKPSKKFFQRQKRKMLRYGTVENRVCIM